MSRGHRPADLPQRTAGDRQQTKETMKTEIVLNVEELEERIAPSISLTNPAGNHPAGSDAANGQAIDYENPAGAAPPGWNK